MLCFRLCWSSWLVVLFFGGCLHGQESEDSSEDDKLLQEALDNPMKPTEDTSDRTLGELEIYGCRVKMGETDYSSCLLTDCEGDLLESYAYIPLFKKEDNQVVVYNKEAIKHGDISVQKKPIQLCEMKKDNPSEVSKYYLTSTPKGKCMPVQYDTKAHAFRSTVDEEKHKWYIPQPPMEEVVTFKATTNQTNMELPLPDTVFKFVMNLKTQAHELFGHFSTPEIPRTNTMKKPMYTIQEKGSELVEK